MVAFLEAMEVYCTYIIQSQTTGQFYVGACDDLLQRFRKHQSGFVKETRGRGPWWVPYCECYDSLSEAEERADEIKSKKSTRYIKALIWARYPMMELS